MKNLLGVDFGTTSLKACLFDETGKLLATESAKYQLITNGDYVEFPVEEFFNVFKSVVDKITAKYKVDCMSLDTQGETLIVLDKNGKPLYNAIIWLDNRAMKQVDMLNEHFGAKRIYELTGQAEVPAGYPVPKIMWLKENEKQVFDKADKYLLLEDYIIYKMTGEFHASRSLYSSSLLMDIMTGEYIDEMLEYIGINKNQLPILHESGELVGEYNGIKIVASALDQIAGITGAGVVKEGIISETTGTALAVSALTKEFPSYYEGLKVSVYYVRKGLYCSLMWAPTAGATLEWFKKNFLGDLEFPEINKLSEEAGIGAEGLICIPHLCGTVMPENNPKVKGAFFGATLEHGKGHFVRAIMESIAYTIKEYVDYIGVEVSEIRSMGGGAKSDIWCNVKSAVLGKKIRTLKENETACLGSALFAGVGTKVYKDIFDAVKVVGFNKEYSADRKWQEEYKTQYAEYKNKEKKLIEIY